MGATRALLDGVFRDRVFVISFLSNVVVAAFIVWIGDLLGVGSQMSTGVVVVLRNGPGRTVLLRTEMGLALGISILDLTTNVGWYRMHYGLGASYTWRKRLTFAVGLTFRMSMRAFSVSVLPL